MNFNLSDAINILNRTPVVLDNLLRDLPDQWIMSNEGPDTWSPYDVMGHLIHGEHTDWIARLNIILSEGAERKFAPFDRFAQFHESNGKSLSELLEEFKSLREKNLIILKSKNISEDDLDRKGIHPVFGEVTLRNLLSTWVAHDMDHISQIVRVMAKQYLDDVGPWKQYLRIIT